MARRAWLTVMLALLVGGTLTALAGAYGVPHAKAKFTVSPRGRYAAHTLTFDGSASTVPAGDSIASYDWTFGDGTSTTSTGPTVTHVYASSAVYTASLVVVDAAGAASSPYTKRLRVHPDVPTASFVYRPRTPHMGGVVTFDASSSADPDGDSIVSYEWAFGDGTTDTTTTPVTTHRYKAEGNYTAVLTVVDGLGNRSQAARRTVAVANTVFAAFRFSPGHPAAGEPVHFDASASHPLAGIIAYRWRFGDGRHRLTSEPFARHTYRHAGIYVVRLTVIGFDGHRSDAAEAVIEVGHAGPPRVRRVRLRVCRAAGRHCPGVGLLVHVSLSAADRLKLTVRTGHGHRLVSQGAFVARPRTRVFVPFAGRPGRRYVLWLRPAGGLVRAMPFRWRR